MRDLMTHVLQVLYMLFLGIVIAAFFGLGVDTFYTAPKAPVYPTSLQKTNETGAKFSDSQIKEQQDFDAAQEKYQKDMQPHNRNVSIVIMLLAVVALALSLTVLEHWPIIANGFLLGGVFSMGYSIILGMSTEDTKFRFLVITVAALVTLTLGYLKFIHKAEKS